MTCHTQANIFHKLIYIKVPCTSLWFYCPKDKNTKHKHTHIQKLLHKQRLETLETKACLLKTILHPEITYSIPIYQLLSGYKNVTYKPAKTSQYINLYSATYYLKRNQIESMCMALWRYNLSRRYQGFKYY